MANLEVTVSGRKRALKRLRTPSVDDFELLDTWRVLVNTESGIPIPVGPPISYKGKSPVLCVTPETRWLRQAAFGQVSRFDKETEAVSLAIVQLRSAYLEVVYKQKRERARVQGGQLLAGAAD